MYGTGIKTAIPTLEEIEGEGPPVRFGQVSKYSLSLDWMKDDLAAGVFYALADCAARLRLVVHTLASGQLHDAERKAVIGLAAEIRADLDAIGVGVVERQARRERQRYATKDATAKKRRAKMK
ncbi:MAG: hypothetical protein JXA69_08610 [Phycisphaerae bacterium]|nr:hypothetical protein [Phycisphaerae bacterium]